MKKIVFVLILFPLLLCSCTHVSQPIQTDQNQPIKVIPLRVCYTAISGSQSVVWYALEKGAFARQGLDVQLTRISSATNAVTALITGEMDFCQTSGAAPANAVASGQEVAVIASLFSVYPQVLMVTAAIQTAQDLKGKSLGISDPGTTSDTAMRVALKALGLQADKDVTLVMIGDEQQRLLAMEAGRIDGTVLISPNTLVARQKGFHELYNLGSQKIPYLHTGITTSRKLLRENRPAALRFVRAICEAIAGMKADPQGSKEVIAKYSSLDPQKDAAILDEVYTTMILGLLERIPIPNPQGIQNLLAEISANNPAALKVKPEDLVDTSILQELQAEGFFK